MQLSYAVVAIVRRNVMRNHVSRAACCVMLSEREERERWCVM